MKSFDGDPPMVESPGQVTAVRSPMVDKKCSKALVDADRLHGVMPHLSLSLVLLVI